MKFAMFIAALHLGFAAVHSSLAPSPAPPPHPAFTLSPRAGSAADTSQGFGFFDAYGDSVWLETRYVRVAARVYSGISGRAWSETLAVVPAWCATQGTPLVAVLPWRGDASRTTAIIDSLCTLPRLPISAMFPGDGEHARMYEPGFFGSAMRPSLFGWDLHCSPRDTSVVRLIFFVVGNPDSSFGDGLRQPWQEAWGRYRSPGDPVPIRADRFVRCYDLKPRDMLATRRVVGELVVDLGRRTIIVPQ